MLLVAQAVDTEVAAALAGTQVVDIEVVAALAAASPAAVGPIRQFAFLSRDLFPTLPGTRMRRNHP